MDYGPLVVTSHDFGAGAVARCPTCHRLQRTEPRSGDHPHACRCGTSLRINPFVVRDSPPGGRWATGILVLALLAGLVAGAYAHQVTSSWELAAFTLVTTALGVRALAHRLYLGPPEYPPPRPGPASWPGPLGRFGLAVLSRWERWRLGAWGRPARLPLGLGLPLTMIYVVWLVQSFGVPLWLASLVGLVGGPALWWLVTTRLARWQKRWRAWRRADVG
jgi:hypothetical protein